VINLQNGSFSLAFPEVAPPTTNITYCCHNRFFFDNVFEELADVGGGDVEAELSESSDSECEELKSF
jgi:hypothetical protein